MKLKILYRKNLKMSSGKIAAQAVHASIAIGAKCGVPVVVLGVSDRKLGEAKPLALAIIRDAGITEVAPKTETCLCFYVDN